MYNLVINEVHNENYEVEKCEPILILSYNYLIIYMKLKILIYYLMGSICSLSQAQ